MCLVMASYLTGSALPCGAALYYIRLTSLSAKEVTYDLTGQGAEHLNVGTHNEQRMKVLKNTLLSVLHQFICGGSSIRMADSGLSN